MSKFALPFRGRYSDIQLAFRNVQLLYKSQVPEQQFFTIQEVCRRWHVEGVTSSHLLDWVSSVDLVLGVRLREAPYLCEQTHTADGSAVTRTRTTTSLSGDSANLAVRTVYVDKESLMHILTAAPGVKVSPVRVYSNLERTQPTSSGHGQQFYSATDLLVGLPEVKRIERLFRMGSSAPMLHSLINGSGESAATRTRWPMVLTSVWFLGLAALAGHSWNELVSLELNALGDFLAGVSAPLTVLWLITQFKQQAKSSANAEAALVEAARRQEDSIRWLRVQAEANAEQLAMDRQRRREEQEPSLNISLGTRVSSADITQHFAISNDGAALKSLEVLFDDGGLSATAPKYRNVRTAADVVVEFALTVPRAETDTLIRLRINYSTSRGFVGTDLVTLKLSTATGKSAEPVFSILNHRKHSES